MFNSFLAEVCISYIYNSFRCDTVTARITDESGWHRAPAMAMALYTALSAPGA